MMVGCRLVLVFGFIPFVFNNSSVFFAAFLLYTPLVSCWLDKRKVDFLYFSTENLQKSLRWLGLFSLCIFPLFLILNHFYQLILGHHYHAGSISGLGQLILFELLLVAFPEEFFFRGYMQTRLNEIWGKKWKVLGVMVGPAFFWTALVFAISHSLIAIQWWHIFIFFPALAFGWLREKTHSLPASIIFHAACNLFAAWVAAHYN